MSLHICDHVFVEVCVCVCVYGVVCAPVGSGMYVNGDVCVLVHAHIMHHVYMWCE